MVSTALGQKGTPRHLPLRTCVGCRTTRPKREMIRLVRLTSGGVEVDVTGKKSGRGAYLCAISSCWELGLKGGRLARALRAEIGSENRERLAEHAHRLGDAAKGETYGSGNPILSYRS